ncbi:hypothetical protein [Aliihoeflea sp. PC F10.4]
MLHLDSVSAKDASYALPVGAKHDPLIGYVLKGLRNCWLPEHGRWSHIYHLDGRDQANESVPESDVFYSLNVLLGMSRVAGAGSLGYDLDVIFDTCARQLLKLNVRKYVYGMALWTSAEMGRDLPGDVDDAIHAFVRDRSNWAHFRAQDLGMILTGLAARAAAGDDRGRDLLEPLFEHLRSNHACASGLFFEGGGALRRRFATFATQTYLTIACYTYFEFSRDARALALANACVKKLIELQGPQGEWPWFFYVPRGQVADFYEVYSVHQDGMAPAFLEFAERHEVAGARDALRRGFNWIFGDNQLGHDMLRPEVGMIVRSHLRRGEEDSKRPRMLRSGLAALTGRSQRLVDPRNLTLRLECRSYHLGWVLWSFAARRDLPEITRAPIFSSTV